MRRWIPCLAALLLVAATCTAQDKVEVGKPAPAVELKATQIKTVFPDAKDKTTLSLKDFEGKKHVVLFFYPKALTGG